MQTYSLTNANVFVDEVKHGHLTSRIISYKVSIHILDAPISVQAVVEYCLAFAKLCVGCEYVSAQVPVYTI